MAVLKTQSQILPVAALLEGLARANDAVVRVGRLGEDNTYRELLTGWFITPDLVIIPKFDREDEGLDARYRIESAKEGTVNWTQDGALFARLSGPELLDGYRSDIALLRVPVPKPHRVLQLSFEKPYPGDRVSIVQYPGGRGVAVSFGEVLDADNTTVKYDADTAPGSSGAPVFDGVWRIIAMHIGSGHEKQLNYGLGRPALQDILQTSQAWPAIASYHNIADDRTAVNLLRSRERRAGSETPDPVLIRAALLPSFERENLSESQASLLVNLVADPRASKWTLRVAERRKILASGGSREALRKHFSPDEPPSPAQQVISKILDGPPYQYDQDNEAHLAWWIQIVRWFEGVVSDLPKPIEISRVLERRRARNRLKSIIDGDFRGRKAELDQLRGWYSTGDGPVVLTGVGGIGKSSIVARLASELDPNALLLWLDFDRADLAPDDAVSVLAAISEQASIQLDDFVPLGSPEKSQDWASQASMLAERLSAAVSPQHRPLLVLDSFEAAQYSTRYQELWPVLELLGSRLPGLRICVTGRVPVPGLELLGRAALPIKLLAMEPDDAIQWLKDRGVTVPEVITRVVELARGIPLIIRLAIRLIELGGKVEDLPRDLPPTIVAGYLYDRVLDRVQNPKFKPLASALLVVRRASKEMLLPLFEGLVDLPPGSPEEWFAELSREMALVDGGNALQPRPEVRAATLALLERDNAQLVKSVNERAIRWYSNQRPPTTEAAAELVYHNLRLGNVASAERAWLDGVGAFLTFAADDIPDVRARNWLLGRLGASSQADDLVLWEQEAAERIRAARSRGLDRIISQILRERTDRSKESPILFHDALLLMEQGQYDKAIELLDTAGRQPGRIGRDRTALRALLARKKNDLRLADELLMQIQDPEVWAERNDRMNALAVLAARIGLSAKLDTEAELLSAPVDWDMTRRLLAPIDVLSPRLRERLERSTPSFEASPVASDLESDSDESSLLDRIERERADPYPAPPIGASLLFGILREWSIGDPWRPVHTYIDLGPLGPNDFTAIELALASRRRWWMAANTHFIKDCRERLLDDSPSRYSQLGAALLGTLAMFALDTPTFSLKLRHIALSKFIYDSVLASGPIRLSKDRWEKVVRLLRVAVGSHLDWENMRSDEEGFVVLWPKQILGIRRKGGYDPLPFVFLICAPDPLEALVEALAGAVHA